AHELQRVGELVDVQHLDDTKLRHLVQVEIVGDDFALQRTRQLDELQIDFTNLWKIQVGNDYFDARHLLNLLEDVEASAATIALQRVGRIGDELQLLEHKLRNHQRAVDEPGLADIRDAAVDADARVEHLVA